MTRKTSFTAALWLSAFVATTIGCGSSEAKPNSPEAIKEFYQSRIDKVSARTDLPAGIKQRIIAQTKSAEEAALHPSGYRPPGPSGRTESP